MTNYPFPCDACGACCRQVNKAQETQYLDRGDGTCIYYIDKENLCSIYETRPNICRIDLQYSLNYSEQYTWSEFVEINLMACQFLKKNS